MKIVAVLSFLFVSLSSFGQEFILKGQVTDGSSKEPVVGARVVANQTYKTLTDLDGNYTLKFPTKGEYTLVVSMMMFDTETFKINIDKPVTSYMVVLGGSLEFEEVKVIGNLVTNRKTPVAVTKISTKQITEELGSRDLPMLLNATPGVYATQSGGGDGDARINIRGFSQRNIGVLIDGVPVNDMENGAVYWSNWFGLDAITSTVQLQRGLGATKLALPSIGGSLNIITKGIGSKEGGMVKQEYGTGNFLRTSLAYNSGQNAKGYGMTLAASYKQGDGWVDGTNSQGVFTYLKLQKKWKNHLTSLSGFMAPQNHGQRSFSQPIRYWDKEFAQDLGINVPDSLAAQSIDHGLQYNQHWGYFTNDDGEKEIKNERLNFYNKPQITLKDFWVVNKKLSISNIAYMSIGRGGGTRINSSSNIILTADDQTIDWDFMIRDNQVTDFFGTQVPSIDKAYSPVLLKAKTIQLASINNHFWVGYLPQFTYTKNENWSYSGGLDFRYYEGEHYQEVTDLLGTDYYVDVDARNQNTRTDMKFVGDKIALQDYNNHRKGLVSWMGTFGQAEYSKGRWTGFVNLSGIRNGYKGIDYFQKKQLTVGDSVLEIGKYDTVNYNGTDYYGTDPNAEFNQTEWKYMVGYTAKFGASFELTEYSNVFMNLGYLSRTPQFSNVIDNNTNSFFGEIANEIIQAVEVGYSFSNKRFGINVNGYFTNWKNKPFPFGVQVPDPNDPEDFVRININGMDAIHYGGEVDLGYKINKENSFEAMFSLGNWVWNSSETIEVPQYNTSFTFDAKGVHVGDAAQTVLSLAYRWEPIKRFYAKVQYQLFDRYFADFSPFDLQGENGGRESWVMPTYGLLNMFVGYTLPVKDNAFVFNASVINLLNTKYISDARPVVGSNNAFEASGAQVFFGSGLRFNLAAAYKF